MHIVTIGWTKFAFNNINDAMVFYTTLAKAVAIEEDYETKENGDKDYNKLIYKKATTSVTLTFKNIDIIDEDVESDPF